MRRRRFLQTAISVFAGILIPANIAFAGAVTATDLLGREITLSGTAKKVILGEGRFVSALGILDRKDPTKRIAGMLGEFKRFDPAGYAQYEKAFPALANIPLFGGTSADSVSVEKVISLKPDLAIFGKSGHGPSPRTRALVDKIEAAGIPIAYIDFRDDPLVNTPKSMTLLGKLLGREKEAAEFVDFYSAQLARVSDRLKQASPAAPKVFIEVHVGRNIPCCFTMGEAMMGKFITFAGGRNIALGLVPGATGTLNPEHLIASQPDVYIGTAIGSPATVSKSPRRIVLGAGATPEMAQATLANGLDRKGISELDAVKTGRAHAVWHHFYNSPLNVAAAQAFAKWIHPEAFADLDPDRTLQTLFSRFQPVPLDGIYWTTVKRQGG